MKSHVTNHCNPKFNKDPESLEMQVVSRSWDILSDNDKLQFLSKINTDDFVKSKIKYCFDYDKTNSIDFAAEMVEDVKITLDEEFIKMLCKCDDPNEEKYVTFFAYDRQENDEIEISRIHGKIWTCKECTINSYYHIIDPRNNIIDSDDGVIAIYNRYGELINEFTMNANNGRRKIIRDFSNTNVDLDEWKDEIGELLERE